VIDEKVTGVSRNRIGEALIAEGVPAVSCGYANLHLLPMFQNRIAYGKNGFPWTSDVCKRFVSYEKGICPVAERMQDRQYLGIEICQHEYTNEGIDSVIEAFQKVWNHLDKF